MKYTEIIRKMCEQMVKTGWASTQHFFQVDVGKGEYRVGYDWHKLTDKSRLGGSGQACAAAIMYSGTLNGRRPGVDVYALISGHAYFKANSPDRYYRTLKNQCRKHWRAVEGVPGVLHLPKIPDQDNTFGRFVIALRQPGEQNAHMGYNSLRDAGVTALVALHVCLAYQYNGGVWGSSRSHSLFACNVELNKLLQYLKDGGNVFKDKAGEVPTEYRWRYYQWDRAMFEGAGEIYPEGIGGKEVNVWGRTKIHPTTKTLAAYIKNFMKKD